MPETLLQLPEVKVALNITGNSLDGLLQEYIEAAESIVGQQVGPLVPTTITRRVSAGTSGLMLPVTPVVSLTSVTAVGATTGLDVETLRAGNRDGIVEYTAGGRFARGDYEVTYVAGWDPVPVGLKRATIALLRHLWKAEQRGSGQRRPGSGTGQAVDDVAPTYLIPYVVAAQLEPFGPGAVFA